MARFTHNSMSIGVHSEVQVQMAKTVVKVYRGVLLEKNDVIIYFLPALQKATAWISLAQPAIVDPRPLSTYNLNGLYRHRIYSERSYSVALRAPLRNFRRKFAEVLRTLGRSLPYSNVQY